MQAYCNLAIFILLSCNIPLNLYELFQRRRQSNQQAQQKQRDKKKQIIEDLKNEIREIWKKIDYYTNLVNSLQDLYDEKANY